MGTIGTVGPAGTITEQPQTFDISYLRALTGETIVGALERVEVQVWQYSVDQLADVEKWQRLAAVPYQPVPDASFSIAFSHRQLVNGDYSWRARLRDRHGTWTDWSDFQAFTLAAEAPVLSALLPSQSDTILLEVPAGLRFSAAYADPASSPPLVVEAQLVEQVVSEAWDAAVYHADLLIWGYTGPAREYDGQRIMLRYSGRTLPPGKTYLWRMRAQNTYGTKSDWLGGQFSVEARDYSIPGTIETVTDTFTQLWETSVIPKPVGLAYDPAQTGWLTVIDSQSRNLQVIQQSDRTVIQSDYLGAIVAYPAGLSFDPADATVLWLLRAPWTQGAGLSGNRLVCLARSDFSVVHNFVLPDGRWTAIKVSAAYAYATNWDDGKIHQFDKATGAEVTAWSITYDTVLQVEPTGIMVDGTTLYYFFYNGGSTKRFLVADESAPTVITGAKSTEGLAILGGEMDSTTHTEMYGDSDLLGKVWKFTLTVSTFSNGGQTGRPEPAITTLGDA